MLKSGRLWFMLLTCAAVVVAALVSFSRWHTQSERRLVSRWRSRIAVLNEPAAAEFVASLRRQDRLAVPTIAEAMTDVRPQVAQAAQESLGNLLADWRQMPPHEAVPRLTALADQLADRYHRFRPEQQSFCRQAAGQMLLWPLEEADFPTDNLVAHCERILTEPKPLWEEADEIRPPGAMFPDATATEETLPPVVSAKVARRRPVEEPSDSHRTTEQTPAPVLQEPQLAPIAAEANSPSGDVVAPILGDARPVEPRRFLQPRAPPIRPTAQE